MVFAWFVDEEEGVGEKSSILTWCYCEVGRAKRFRGMKSKWHLGMVVHTASPLVFSDRNENFYFCFILFRFSVHVSRSLPFFFLIFFFTLLVQFSNLKSLNRFSSSQKLNFFRLFKYQAYL